MLLNVTIPVFDEEAQLGWAVSKLYCFLSQNCQFDFELVIADNGSTDRTAEIATALSAAHPEVRVAHLDEKGRGRALKKVWAESHADILSYMDVDLSTDLASFPPLVEALDSGHFDVATGSRLLKSSLTTRGLKRETLSRCYNFLLRTLLHTKFSDAQCGFKAITRSAADRLMPFLEDTGWFFDTELLVIAEKCGYRIFELPIHWTEDTDTRVQIIRTAWADLKGIIRLHRNLRRGAYAKLAPITTVSWRET